MGKNKHHDGSGPSQRQLRVGELIRRTLSDVLMRGDVHDPELNRMSITVGEVRTSPDLKIATVYVMPLGGGNRAEAIDALKRNRGELRHHLMREMTLKYAPDLRFLIDETFDQMDETRRLFEDETVRRDVEAPNDDDADAPDAEDAAGKGGA
jgi:ribosome-binding factor A